MGRLYPHARRADLSHREQALRLEVRVGTGAVHERAPDLPRAREGPGRLEQHQRDDLPARQPAGLRAVGGRPGHGSLGLRALPAVLQEDGNLPRRGREMARLRGPARAGTRARDQPAVPGVLRGGTAGRVPADRRRQRLPAGRLRGVRPQRAPRPEAERRARVPASGHEPAQPDRDDPRLRHPDPVRGQPGDRSRIPGAEAGPPRARQGGDPLRRRHQLTATAPALRGRQRR